MKDKLVHCNNYVLWYRMHGFELDDGLAMVDNSITQLDLFKLYSGCSQLQLHVENLKARDELVVLQMKMEDFILQGYNNQTTS